MWYEYNALGQITSSTQTTAGQSFEFSYTYTAGGALASETYPSGRVMTTVYDDAGRPKYVKGQNGDVTTYYAGDQSNAIQYASHGGISSMTMGNGITESRTYNSSLQPTVIQAGSLLTILNCYQTSDDPTNCGSLPVTGNNGNVQRQKITRGSQSWVENYTYDAVNRLATATETGVWSQTYGYDAYGNRWLSASSGVPVSSLTPTSSTNFNAATNRLTGSNTYDSRGNLTTYGSYTLAYDGEGRVVTASGVTPSTKYEYDGTGNRVRAHSCSGSTTCEAGSGASTTLFVYDAFGRLAVEYRPDAVAAATSYYTQDHLGSTRLETNASGQAVKCTDYVPFGEEIPAGYGSRSSCFNSNDNRIKYTGKERDGETGLDYFLARYYSGALGRFTSPDPLMASARKSDPQTWNRYAYVSNNPTNRIDPDGLFSPPPSSPLQFYGVTLMMQIWDLQMIQRAMMESNYGPYMLQESSGGGEGGNAPIVRGLENLDKRTATAYQNLFTDAWNRAKQILDKRGACYDLFKGQADDVLKTLSFKYGDIEPGFNARNSIVMQVNEETRTVTINKESSFFSQQDINGNTVETRMNLYGKDLRAFQLFSELGHFIPGVLVPDGLNFDDEQISNANTILKPCFPGHEIHE